MSSEPDGILLHCSSSDLATFKEHLKHISASPATIQNLVTAAIKSRNLDITRYLLTTYPQTVLSEDAIRHSVYSGSIPLCTVVLAKDPWIANMDFDKRGTPLAIALISRQPLPFIAFLLESGADPNKDTGLLPSHLALAAKRYPSTDVLALLLQHGADVAHTAVLHAATHAGNVETVRFLLTHGARPSTDVSAATLPALPLHRAAQTGNEEIAEMLIQHGADVDAVDADGMKAIDVARESGDGEMVSLLAKHHREDRDKSLVV